MHVQVTAPRSKIKKEIEGAFDNSDHVFQVYRRASLLSFLASAASFTSGQKLKHLGEPFWFLDL